MSYDHPVRYTSRKVAVSSDGVSFVPLGGLRQSQFTDTPTTADNSDLNSGYYGGGDVPTAGRFSGTATVVRRHDTTAYDPGQEIVRLAAETQSQIYVRWWDTSFSAAEAKQAKTFTQWQPQAGDRTALETVNITFNIQGGPTDITNPGGGSAPAVWAADTVYQIGAQVSLTGGEVLKCISGGTSDTLEPSAPGEGSTVTDGTVEWLQVA